MRILLISTYDLGHQPLGLANAAAWLRAAGHEVLTADLAVERRPSLQPAPDAAAFYLPMHTAARLAAPVIQAVRRRGPETRIACFGLYAPPNAEYLRSLGAEAILGGESEPELVRWAAGEPHRALSLDRLQFPIPDRSTLPPLSLRPPRHRRRAPPRRLHRILPRLQAPLPPLPCRPRLQRNLPRRR